MGIVMAHLLIDDREDADICTTSNDESKPLMFDSRLGETPNVSACINPPSTRRKDFYSSNKAVHALLERQASYR